MSRPDVVIAGAGMAGLVAAAHVREKGGRALVLEKGDRPGGSMLLSSGVVWRHREFRQFRAECPEGDVKLQRLVHERLDTHIEWLTGLGVRVRAPSTGNPETVGVRFDAASLTETLARQAGDDIRLGQALVDLPSQTPLILATGGFPASRELVGRYITPAAGSMMIRATPWSTGDGLRLGQAAGAETTSGLDEFYGRAMPAPPAVVRESDFVQLAQLYAHHARIASDDGERFAPRTWSEIDVVQWMARKPGARARFAVPVESLGVRPRDLTIGEMIASAERAGGRVQRTPSTVSVDVVAGITSTLGGLKAGVDACVAPGVFAAGSDVGGIASGGYASGLAAALVLGRAAADSALGLS